MLKLALRLVGDHRVAAVAFVEAARSVRSSSAAVRPKGELTC